MDGACESREKAFHIPVGAVQVWREPERAATHSGVAAGLGERRQYALAYVVREPHAEHVRSALIVGERVELELPRPAGDVSRHRGERCGDVGISHSRSCSSAAMAIGVSSNFVRAPASKRRAPGWYSSR